MYVNHTIIWRSLVVLLTTLTAVTCDSPAKRLSQPDGQESLASNAEASIESLALDPESKVSDQPVRLVFIGDSLTAGFGLPKQEAFPQLVQQELAARGLDIAVINAGISGDTSAGGLSRIDWILRQRPDIVAICLGANDGLRGLSTEMTERNLRTILDKIIAAHAHPVLIGMRLPPNLGPEYVARFESIYPALADDFQIPFVPFLLEGVGGVPSLNLPDGIHPNAQGHRHVATSVLPVIENVLEMLDSE